MKNLLIFLMLLLISGCSVRSNYCPKLANEIQEMISKEYHKKTYKRQDGMFLISYVDYIHSE